jgi:hypothetical protein
VSTGGTATITCLAFTSSRSEWTVTPCRPWTIRRTGESRTTLRPSFFASRLTITCEPPPKRNICAPSRVLKLRSNVPTLSSLPEAAM